MNQAFKSDGSALGARLVLVTVLLMGAVYSVDYLSTGYPPEAAGASLEPILSLPGGYYDRDVRLTITAPVSDAEVIFTLDGSVPSHTVGTLCTSPILLSAATPAITVVRARAILPDAKLGPVVNASYIVGVSATLPMLSLIMDPPDLWDGVVGIYANPWMRGSAWERPVDITYVDRDGRLGFHIPAGVRIHGHGSRDYDKKSFRFYFRREYGVSRLEYPLFAEGDVQTFKRLVVHGGGQDCPLPPHFHWTLLRNQLADSLASELGGYATRSHPALLFINGEPWGIYQIRERIDARFFADNFGVESVDYLEAPQLFLHDSREGDREHWNHLTQFVATHSLADPANYAYVESQVDIENFIDYNLIQIYAANADWPRQNVHQFRPRVQGGRWRWVFWDVDRGFGLDTFGQVNADLIGKLLQDDVGQTDRPRVLLVTKLLENRVFRDRFVSRVADLLNTTLAPASVIAHIDTLAGALEPDVSYELARWSCLANWGSNVEGLRDFARRRPDYVREQTVQAFQLSGIAQLTFGAPAGGQGHVAINGTLVRDLPWQGTYFRGVPVRVTAVPAPGYRFAGWDLPEVPQTPVITLTIDGARTLSPRFEAAGHDVPQPGDVVFTEYRVPGEVTPSSDGFELLVTRPGGVDLRGWRVTDNDTKNATDEGSLVFVNLPVLARVPQGTRIRVAVPSGLADLSPGTNGAWASQDLPSAWDSQIVLTVGEGSLDITIDPGFRLGPSDNLVLLAPGPTTAFGDDQGVAFVARGSGITPASFGVLADGVLEEGPH